MRACCPFTLLLPVALPWKYWRCWAFRMPAVLLTIRVPWPFIMRARPPLHWKSFGTCWRRVESRLFGSETMKAAFHYIYCSKSKNRIQQLCWGRSSTWSRLIRGRFPLERRMETCRSRWLGRRLRLMLSIFCCNKTLQTETL